MDQPPFSIAALAAVRALLGDSLPALRLLPALSGAATILSDRADRAQSWAAAASPRRSRACARCSRPVWLAVDHFYSMNAFDTFFWSLSAWLLLNALDEGRLSRPGRRSVSCSGSGC